MCSVNAVYPPSFPLDQMSILELQKAVTRPERTISFLNRGKTADFSREDAPSDPFEDVADSEEKNAGTPLSRALVLDAPSFGLNIDSRFRSLFIIPGGRYLVANGMSFLSVWDLHDYSKARKGPIVLQPLEEPVHSRCVFMVTPVVEENGFRITVSGTLRNDDGLMRYVELNTWST